MYFAFDLLYLNGRSLLGEPLETRKAALKKIVKGARIRFSDHLDADGPDAFREACRLGLEGIISKPREQPYLSGKRIGWVKTKCIKRQEFVIGGFTDPEGTRAGLGALLVGYYEGTRLVFSGKVGTGFTHATLKDLGAQLAKLRADESPFDEPVRERNVTWVRPELVAQVGFSEWTRDGRLRHPRFLGLRDDKAAEEVVRE